VAATLPVSAPGGLLRTSPVTLSAGPANGGLTEGLNGWDALGAEPALPLSPGVRVVGNTTLVSPPLLVPPGAQTLAVTLRAPGGDGLMVVSARPLEGGPDIELGTLEPGTARRSWAVGVGGLGGRQVRIVLDPVPALGTTLDVFGVGPVTAALPGWTAAPGALDRRGSRAHGSLFVSDTPLGLRSPVFALGAGARELLVAVRGQGTVRASAGRRAAVLTATTAWRDLHVPVRGARTTLILTATPGLDGLELRDVGLIRRQVAVRVLAVGVSGSRRVVRATLGAAGAGLVVEARARSGRRLARVRADSGGRFMVRTPRSAGRVTLVVPGDRTHIGTRVSR